MNKKQIVDLVIAVFLILGGVILLIFPLANFINVKYAFMGILGFYGILNLIQFLMTRKSKDYEGLFTTIASIIVLIISYNLQLNKVKWNLAFVLFIWVILMSFIKLKKADYYNDRKNKIWILKIVTLIIFILTGLLTTVNLYYSTDVQILVLGFFFLIHGILELVDPLVVYLMEK